MKVYYNEIDPYCAVWLQNLMDAGHIPAGDIDTRSIEDVVPDELRRYTQCHFFAGLGGWASALQLAGWGTRPVWTGSCPCQPFSVAGKGNGAADKRHLWPAWFHLISQCRPAVVFGEQVAAAVGHQWLDGVCADLEGQSYGVGASVLPACAVGAPHRRDRLWFVADTNGSGLEKRERECGALRTLGGKSQREDATHDGRSLADDERACSGREIVSGEVGRTQAKRPASWFSGSSDGNPWACSHWITGHDGKARLVEPSIRLLAHGVPGRVGRLRAYGNAIVPQAAAEFVRCYLEARQPLMLERAA